MLQRATGVGRSVLLERLSAGGMGVVSSAYDGRLDRRVALARALWQAPALRPRALEVATAALADLQRSEAYEARARRATLETWLAAHTSDTAAR